jgi:hypothetical protein
MDHQGVPWLSACFPVADSRAFIGLPLLITGACGAQWSVYLIGTSSRSALDAEPSSIRMERKYFAGSFDGFSGNWAYLEKLKYVLQLLSAAQAYFCFFRQ